MGVRTSTPLRPGAPPFFPGLTRHSAGDTGGGGGPGDHLDATQDSSPVRRCQSVITLSGLLIDGCDRAGGENINSSLHSLAGACIPERGSSVEPLGMPSSSGERSLAGVDLAPTGLGVAVGLPSGETADIAWPVGAGDPN